MFWRMEILQYFKVVPQYCTWVTFHHCICPDAGFYPLCHYIHITDVLFIKHHRHHLVDILWECSHPCTPVVIHLINSILIFDFLSLRSFKIWRFRYLWGCSLKTSQYYFYPTVCWPTFYCIKRQNKKKQKTNENVFRASLSEIQNLMMSFHNPFPKHLVAVTRQTYFERFSRRAELLKLCIGNRREKFSSPLCHICTLPPSPPFISPLH